LERLTIKTCKTILLSGWLVAGKGEESFFFGKTRTKEISGNYRNNICFNKKKTYLELN
jgi:hypothetical protein